MSKHIPGPWHVFIDDTGGENTGYPISISTPDIDNEDGKTIVRQGGFYPYIWDEKLSKAEVNANARLIAAAPDLLAALQEMYVSACSNASRTPSSTAFLSAQNAIIKAGGKI